MNNAASRVISGKSWEGFCDGLKAAGQTILRPETPETKIDRAEGWRYLSRLTCAALERMVGFAEFARLIDPPDWRMSQPSNSTCRSDGIALRQASSTRQASARLSMAGDLSKREANCDPGVGASPEIVAWRNCQNCANQNADP